MTLKATTPDLTQPTLFKLGDRKIGISELFPEVWKLMEGLSNPILERRITSLEELELLGGAKYSPLVAYVIATRISDPNIEVRTKVVRLLGDLLCGDTDGEYLPEEIRESLSAYLGQMRTREIYGILQVLVNDPEMEFQVNKVLRECPYAGTHLADISASRKTPMPIRLWSVKLIGEIGYLDAIPALERILSRLEARMKGQKTLPFNQHSVIDESDLLPVLQKTLLLLRSP